MHRRLVLAVSAATAVAALTIAVAPALAGHRARRGPIARRPTAKLSYVPMNPAAAPPGLVFGIYPGGAAGTVGPSGVLKPEDPARRLAALKALRPPGRPFVVHLYAAYTGPGGWSASDQVGADIEAYVAAGFDAELVLTYRPADGGSPSDVAGFADFTRQTVRAFGPLRRFVSLQVTNEANVGGAANASDGFYGGAEDALIAGVVAAKQETIQTGSGHVAVGFNWAASGGQDDAGFWRYLRQHGGQAFARSVDWVGLDVYPGTWGPAISSADLSRATSSGIVAALRTLRRRYIPMAGLPAAVALHISENGYPTGPGRSPQMQAVALRAAVTTADAAATAYGVTDYRWFDLRDADSSNPSFESQYGLLTDAYAPKPAFAVYRGLVANLSAPSRAATPRLRRTRVVLRPNSRFANRLPFSG